jgi:hypothetical protein
MPNPYIGVAIIAIGIGLFMVFGATVMASIMAIAGGIWTGIAVLEKVAKRPSTDTLGNRHSGETGRFISDATYARSYVGIGVAIILPVMTRADTLVNYVPLFVGAPPEWQIAMAGMANITGWLLS